MAKRRTPPLFEVLSGPSRRAGPGGYVGQRIPIEVRIPGVSEAGQSPSSATDMRPRNVIGIISVVVALIFVVGFGVWVAAYYLGQREQQAHQKEQINAYLNTVTPAPTTVIPAVPAPAAGPASAPGSLTNGQTSPDSSPSNSAAAPVDPRRPGNNYLHIVTLSWKDADRAVAYLAKNGVSAAAVPAGAAKTVDPSEARAKNLPHLVFALEAIPSDQYRTTERSRQELVERVRRIGKKWQSEEKGPSDFGEPGWFKFK